MKVIVAIYVIWIAATVILWLLGASGTVIGSMVGAPIGWTIGLLLIVGFFRLARP